MGGSCGFLAVCFNFTLHIMGVFQPVTNVRQKARAITDGGLIAFCQSHLDFDKFRSHDPDLQFHQMDRDLQRGGAVWRRCCRICAGGNF